MPRKLFKLVLIVFGVGIVVALCLVVANANRTSPAVPMPYPNGYDDFMAAGNLVTRKDFDFNTLTREQLALLDSENHEALKLLRTGLSRQCRVPIESPTSDPNRVDRLVSPRWLIMALCAEGRLAALEGRTNDAARIYVEGVRFSQECCRGGMLNFKAAGGTFEEMAATPLRSLTNNLDANSCRWVAQELALIDAREEPFGDTLEHENAWQRSRSGPGLWGHIERISIYIDQKQTRDWVAAKIHSNTLERRKIIVAFAARAYELNRGRPPQNIAGLVPGYLKAVPKDPVTGKDLGLGPQTNL